MARFSAPIDGIVSASTITTIGQVVTSGQEVMRIVPSGGDACAAQTASASRREPNLLTDCGVAIDIQAYVTNEDIGFVSPGQDVVIKVDSFPYTRYGTIAGKVEEVASDAIPADQANTGLTDATRASDPASHALTPSARPMTDLVFETRIKPALDELTISGKSVHLVPGMTVTIEIRTGSRKIIDYLFSPLVETMETAMRER